MKTQIIIEQARQRQGKYVSVFARYATTYQSDPSGDKVLRGLLVAVAERERGASAFRGPQFDLVIYDKVAGKVWTVAAARVREIQIQ